MLFSLPRSCTLFLCLRLGLDIGRTVLYCFFTVVAICVTCMVTRTGPLGLPRGVYRKTTHQISRQTYLTN